MQVDCYQWILHLILVWDENISIANVSRNCFMFNEEWTNKTHDVNYVLWILCMQGRNTKLDKKQRKMLLQTLSLKNVRKQSSWQLNFKQFVAMIHFNTCTLIPTLIATLNWTYIIYRLFLSNHVFQKKRSNTMYDVQLCNKNLQYESWHKSTITLMFGQLNADEIYYYSHLNESLNNRIYKYV